MNNQPPNPPTPSSSSGAKVYEMQWDCRFCGTKKLLGKTHRFCPNCGGQQDPSWRYFPSDAEKVAVQDHVYVGADKVCASCKTLNSAKAEFCTNCGSPMTKAAEAKLVGERKAASGQAFETEDLKARQRAAQQAPAAAAAVAAKPAVQPTKSRRNTCLVVLAVLAVIIGGGIFALTRTSTSNATVTGYRWERSITIEALQPVSQSSNGSCSSVAPSDSYSRVERTEKTGSHQEADGQTCSNKQVDQGDGTFKEEQECSTNYKTVDDFGPVCHYTVNRWSQTRTADSQGDKTTAPYWADTKLQGGGCTIVGCERENGRKETYYLEFKAGDKTFECPVPVDQWNNTKLEAAFTVKVGSVLKDVRCDTLAPAT